jgi:hypothetical protein
MQLSKHRGLSRWDLISAALMSLLAPVLVEFLQSMLVLHRGYRLRFAFLYQMLDDFSDGGLWIGGAIIAVITFLILLPFLRFPVLSRFVFICLCIGWTYLFYATEPVTSRLAKTWSNSAAGNAGLASRSTIGSAWPGVPEKV